MTENSFQGTETSEARRQWQGIQAALRDPASPMAVSVTARCLETGETFDIGGDTVFVPASTIKLLILAGLARAFDDGRLSAEDRAPVTLESKVKGSGVLNWLTTGLELSLADHAWLMIAISDNTASNVLIDAVGIPALKETANRLKLERTELNRRFLGRWPEPGEPENVVTSRDLVTLLEAIETDRAALPERCAWMRRVLADQQHRDRLARDLPDGIAYAGKTGSLTGITHDCGVLSGPGGKIAIAVLTKGFDDPYAADAFIGRIGHEAALLITGQLSERQVDLFGRTHSHSE